MKGYYKGVCNFTTCKSGQPATWFNFSTLRYYCEDCARMLNKENQAYILSAYGHALLIPVTPPDRIHAEAQESEESEGADLREIAKAFLKDMEILVSSPDLLREALRLAELCQPLTLTDRLSTKLRARLAARPQPKEPICPMDTDATGPWHLPKEPQAEHTAGPVDASPFTSDGNIPPQAEASGELERLIFKGNGGGLRLDTPGEKTSSDFYVYRAEDVDKLLAARPVPTDEKALREALEKIAVKYNDAWWCLLCKQPVIFGHKHWSDCIPIEEAREADDYRKLIYIARAALLAQSPTPIGEGLREALEQAWRDFDELSGAKESDYDFEGIRRYANICKGQVRAALKSEARASSAEDKHD